MVEAINLLTKRHQRNIFFGTCYSHETRAANTRDVHTRTYISSANSGEIPLIRTKDYLVRTKGAVPLSARDGRFRAANIRSCSGLFVRKHHLLPCESIYGPM